MRQVHTRRWLLFIAASFGAVFFVGCMFFGFSVYQMLHHPMVTDDKKPTIVRVDKQTSAGSFVSMLKARHFVQSPRLLLQFIRMQGLSKQLKAGIYQVKNGESVVQFLYRVAEGDVLMETFRIIEGTTQAQVSANLQQAGNLEYRGGDWIIIKGSHPSAEGLLLADTYHYDAGSQSKDLLEHAHRNLQQFLDYSWQNRSLG